MKNVLLINSNGLDIDTKYKFKQLIIKAFKFISKYKL